MPISVSMPAASPAVLEGSSEQSRTVGTIIDCWGVRSSMETPSERSCKTGRLNDDKCVSIGRHSSFHWVDRVQGTGANSHPRTIAASSMRTHGTKDGGFAYSVGIAWWRLEGACA